ncbi:MAG: ABC transporter ATP-binding protein [Lachnospiraceae bacterium]|nr:ABC transporter ATP-binding protein [Lachnospiraceae bacterium]
MNKEIAIEVKNLCKTYKLYERNRDRLREALHLTRKPRHKEHHALYDVSFDIRTGETVGIIGTNGSGKSTILKIITGVLNATSGEVNVNGRISALLELGAGFNPEYTGLENIYLNGTMIGFSEEEIDAKLDDILAFADIGDFVHQPVKTYSSGMFVRLAFALAINIEPEILIVDEALSVGDVFFQSKCYHKFEEFKEQGKTILFVSHDMSSIAKYCDRVILLEKGKKLGEGAPKKMLDIYKQVLVGQYEAPAEAVEEKTGPEPSGSKDAGSQKAQVSGNTEDASKNGNPEEIADVETLEYGSGKAQITEVFVTDLQGRRINAVMKGTECTVHMKVEIRQDVPAPIFALSFKDVKGTEICGTNTMFEKTFLEPCKAGEKKEITFTQQVDLQGGEYLLSFGCTGYEGDDFTVYHRLYDALQLTVVSEKNTVGFYDMNSKVVVKDI